MVRTGEAAVTVWTLERFDASVFAEMSCQFIRPSKLPRAPFPCTFVGLFSCRRDGGTGVKVHEQTRNPCYCPDKVTCLPLIAKAFCRPLQHKYEARNPTQGILTCNWMTVKTAKRQGNKSHLTTSTQQAQVTGFSCTCPSAKLTWELHYLQSSKVTPKLVRVFFLCCLKKSEALSTKIAANEFNVLFSYLFNSNYDEA